MKPPSRTQRRRRRLNSCICHGCDQPFDCAQAIVVDSPCCHKPVLVCADCAWAAMTDHQHLDGAANEFAAPEVGLFQ
jgi:hypothetical protein